MSVGTRTIARLLLGSSLVLPAVSWAQSRPSRESYRDSYGILSERNIFLRDRHRSRSGRDEPSSRPAPPPRLPEETLVLTGVVFEEGECRAYVENMENGSVIKLRIGEPVSRGIVSHIQIDAIEYEQAGRRTWIEIGRSLTGAAVTTAPSRELLAESGSTTQPAGSTPLPNPNDPNLSIEEKMRLRRLQELGGK
jgi:hypothetical protein